MPPLNAIPLRRVSTVEALTAALRDQILDGALPAGAPLREAELCEIFGVSRHTVRTALQTLAHEGLARHEPNRGVSVPRLTTDDVTDLFRLRATLELNAARVLAREPERREPTRAAVRALESIGDDASWTEVRDADLNFHRALVDALESPRTSRTYAALLAELRVCFLELQHELEDHGDVVHQHTEILDAIESGDADEATRLLQAHLDRARDDIAGVYRRRDGTAATG